MRSVSADDNAVFNVNVEILCAHIEYLVDTALSLLPVDVHDEVDAAPHVFFSGVDAQATAPTHHQRSKSMDRLFRATGMDGGERATMAGIHGIEQGPRFGPAHFAHDDAVWSVTEDCLKQVLECDLAAVSVCLRLGRDDMRLADVQLRCVFDDQDALI